jgi:nucleotide-binding universal stress UspA family protein
MLDRAELNHLALGNAGMLLRLALKDKLPSSALDHMQVRIGPIPLALSQAADEYHAQLVVVGGKHHSALGRWLSGNTTHQMVRMSERPLLVVGPQRPGSAEGRYSRILAAIDLSPGSGPTLDSAVRLARLFGARLHVLHVVEPLPMLPGLAPGLDEYTAQQSEAESQLSGWPQIDFPHSDLVRRGRAAEAIAAAATEWGADLLVMGSHGRGLMDRLLIGSVAEQLLNRLPTSLLVVPVSPPSAGAKRRARLQRPSTSPLPAA